MHCLIKSSFGQNIANNAPLMRSLRCHSLHAAGGDARAVARALLAALDKAPSLLLWLADTTQPDHIAAELDAAAPVVVGGVSRAGLIGGGSEYERKAQVERAVALAVTLPVGATATAWYSSPTGLPELPAATWEMFATAPPDASPHLLMMGAPPHDAAFPIESFLASLDRVLPWANKVGGLLAGSSSLYVGAKRHDGGVAGVALQGVALDALVCQGATPVGPSFRISKARGVSVLELDGTAVGQHEALDALLRTESAVSGGTLMAGLSVPCGPTAAAGGAGGAAAAAAAARIAHAPEYVIRPILSYSREGGALQLGALRMATALALWAVQAQGGAAAFLRLGIGSEAPPESPSAWCLAIASTRAASPHGRPPRLPHVWPPRRGAGTARAARSPPAAAPPLGRRRKERAACPRLRVSRAARRRLRRGPPRRRGRPARVVPGAGRRGMPQRRPGSATARQPTAASSGGDSARPGSLSAGRPAAPLSSPGLPISPGRDEAAHFNARATLPGAGLYGELSAESRELAEALGPAATGGLAGWFAGGEIGPVGQRTFVHTYTTSLALLRQSK